MINKECIIFNTYTLIMFIIVLIIFIISNIFYDKIDYNTISNEDIQQIKIINDKNIDDKIIKSNELLKNDIIKSNEFLKKDIIKTLNINNNVGLYNEEDTLDLDKQVLYNDFTPPVKRYINRSYNDKRYINMSTHGNADNYQLLGIIINNNNTKAFNLFGRQTYPSSSEYEYYIIGNIDNTQIKIPLTNTREIFDKDIIPIPELNEIFTTSLYKYNTPKYHPI